MLRKIIGRTPSGHRSRQRCVCNISDPDGDMLWPLPRLRLSLQKVRLWFQSFTSVRLRDDRPKASSTLLSKLARILRSRERSEEKRGTISHKPDPPICTCLLSRLASPGTWPLLLQPTVADCLKALSLRNAKHCWTGFVILFGFARLRTLYYG